MPTSPPDAFQASLPRSAVRHEGTACRPAGSHPLAGRPWLLWGCLAWLIWLAAPAAAQRHKWHDEGFDYRRVVELPAGAETSPEVVVAECFTHGAIRRGAEQVAVFSNRELVASRVLQVGPGDFLRVTFQTAPGQPRYYVYYGGRADGDEEAPNWSTTAGLLMETRRWVRCDVSSFESVQRAFAEAGSYGGDFVSGVFHRHNPNAPEPGPFLSRYAGLLHAPLSGEYTFYTSSQDCSFLLLDGKLIVASPGQHPPASRARFSGAIRLEKGPHRFEYYHAAVGDACCMVAAWRLPRSDKPTQIPPEAFRHDRVLRAPPVFLEHREDGYLPDYRMAILGDLPSPDGEPAMVRAQLVDSSVRAVTLGGKFAWDFGDGQHSEFKNPGHVFLHPGAYRIALRVTRGGKDKEIANLVHVTRQFIIDSKSLEDEDLAAYLEALKQYNAQNLDAVGLVQLVRAYLLAEDPVNAVQAAQAAFQSEAAGHTDETRWALIRLVGPVLRDQLDNPRAAADLWMRAAQLIKQRGWQVACAVEAADLALNDLLDLARAQTMLEFIERRLDDAQPVTRSQYFRVRGQAHARTGDGREARASYEAADKRRELSWNVIERNAWRGAYSRSTEAFLRSQELTRARQELDRWQRDFPTDTYEGYWSLLKMQACMDRGRFEQAIVVARDLLTVNSRSPYADQLLFRTADCEEGLDRKLRAVAAYQALIADYPGSRLVEAARYHLKRLSDGRPREAAPDQAERQDRKKRKGN